MTDDRTRGLEETVAAQVQRLGELAKLHDHAHAAKQYLIGEHAEERKRRQRLALAMTEAVMIIVGLLDALDMKPDATTRKSAMKRADAWLAANGGRS